MPPKGAKGGGAAAQPVRRSRRLAASRETSQEQEGGSVENGLYTAFITPSCGEGRWQSAGKVSKPARNVPVPARDASSGLGALSKGKLRGFGRPGMTAARFCDKVTWQEDDRDGILNTIRRLTQECVEELIFTYAHRERDLDGHVTELQQKLQEAAEERDQLKARYGSSMRRTLQYGRLAVEQAEQERAEKEAAAVCEAQALAHTQEAATTPSAGAFTSPTPKTPREAAVTTIPATAPQAASTQPSAIRKVLGYIVTPFARRLTGTSTAAPASASAGASPESPLTSPARAHTGTPAAPAEQRPKIFNPTITFDPPIEDAMVASPEHTDAEWSHTQGDASGFVVPDGNNEHHQTLPQESTPSSGNRRASQWLCPSTKNRYRPSSLSAITENTEQSTQVNLTEQSSAQREVDPTPSKRKRQEEPIEEISTPLRTPATVKRRSVTSVRKARAVKEAAAAAASRKPYSWERPSSTSQPREPNADIRLAKITRLRDIEAELKRLRQDEDIIAITGHPRKRVKVDDLAVIPHNAPGDSTSTFRVPDIDSDDEMEVDENYVDKMNAFEAQEVLTAPALAAGSSVTTTTTTPASATLQTPVYSSMTRATPGPPTILRPNEGTRMAPPPVPATTSMFTPATATSTQPQHAEDTPAAVEQPTFTFPDVGPIPDGYSVTDDFIKKAYQQFSFPGVQATFN